MVRQLLGISINKILGVGAVVLVEPTLDQLINQLTAKFNFNLGKMQLDDVLKVIAGVWASRQPNEIISNGGTALIYISLARIMSSFLSGVTFFKSSSAATTTSVTNGGLKAYAL